MISILTNETAKSGEFARPNESDNFLKAIVDACVSNVAVLDESGNILYASKAWRVVQQASDQCQMARDGAYYFELQRLTNGSRQRP